MMNKEIDSLVRGAATLESKIEDHIAREMMSFSVEECTHDASILLLRNSLSPIYERNCDDPGLPSPDSVDKAVLGRSAAAVVCFLASREDHGTNFVSMSSVGGRCVMSLSLSGVKQTIPYGTFREIYIDLVRGVYEDNNWVLSDETVEAVENMYLGSLTNHRAWVDKEEPHSLCVYLPKQHPRNYGGKNCEPLPSLARIDEMMLGGAAAVFTFREAVTSRGIVVFQTTCALGRCTLARYLRKQELSAPETIEYQRFREMYEGVCGRKLGGK